MASSPRAPSSRQENLTRVLNALRKGPLSNADIGRHTELGPSTVSSLVAELEELKLVERRLPERQGADRLPPGRPPSNLVALAAGVAVGVDIGHTQIQVAVADSGGELLAEPLSERDFNIDRYEVLDTLELAAGLIKSSLEGANVSSDQVRGVAIGIPAPVDKETHLVASERLLPAWRGLSRSITETMADLLEPGLERRIPIFLENDANLCVLGEVARGVLRDRNHAVFIKAGVGVGSGLLLNGQLYRGSIGAAGELGHTPVAAFDPAVADAGAGPPPRCGVCGSVGCLEAFASARGVMAQLRPLPRTYGKELSPADVVKMAAEEVDAALAGKRSQTRAVIQEAGRKLGIAVAGLVNLLDPEVIVVGGVLAKAGELFLEPIRREISSRAVRIRPDQVAVVESRLREKAELHGAIALVLRHIDPLTLLSAARSARLASQRQTAGGV